MSTIGSRIRQKRQELGMSVDELAARLGKNRATVYRYESDDIENFPISIIGPLAEALQVSPAYLMGWIETEQPATKDDDGLAEIVKIFTALSKEEIDGLRQRGHNVTGWYFSDFGFVDIWLTTLGLVEDINRVASVVQAVVKKGDTIYGEPSHLIL